MCFCFIMLVFCLFFVCLLVRVIVRALVCVFACYGLFWCKCLFDWLVGRLVVWLVVFL